MKKRRSKGSLKAKREVDKNVKPRNDRLSVLAPGNNFLAHPIGAYFIDAEEITLEHS